MPMAEDAVIEPDSNPAPMSSNRRANNRRSNKYYNILNIFAYVLNLVASYLGGVAGWFGGLSNAELSSKYQTLVTPSAGFFGYIWGVIFMFQALFVAAQLLPQVRDHPLVQEGVSYTYILVCAAQAAWAILFGYELLIAAFVAIVVVLVGLLYILSRSWDVVERESKKAARARVGTDEGDFGLWASSSRLSYWLLRFPFAVHAGWIASATVVMLSVVLVSREVNPDYELWAAVLGVSLLFGMCMGLLLRQDKGAPAYSFPLTVAYASLGIMWELQTPSQSILERHQESSISLVRNVAGFSAVMITVALVSRSIALVIRDHIFTRKTKDSDEDDGIGYIEASRAQV